ncbi:MAG: transcriptional regulator [Thauera sp.]|nr:transcriptional regulator [Thauera sp.]
MQHQRNSMPAALANFDQLPDSAMVDVRTVSAVLGRSPSSIWRDARNGRLPAPIKTGPACTRWNVAAIRRHLAALGVPA